jgi:hypothetical protein
MRILRKATTIREHLLMTSDIRVGREPPKGRSKMAKKRVTSLMDVLLVIKIAASVHRNEVSSI